MNEQLRPGTDIQTESAIQGLTPYFLKRVLPSAPYRLILWLVFLIFAVIFDSTCAPLINNNVIPNLDKIVHFMTYGLISWLFISVPFYFLSHIKPILLMLASFTFVLLFGVLNEYIQSFTPGRTASVYDVCADLAGASVFLAIWWWRVRPMAFDRPSNDFTLKKKKT